jgi:hypothetical protein
MDSNRGFCPSCNLSFRLPASFRGSQTRCPKCGKVAEIAAASAGESSQAEKQRSDPAGRERALGKPQNSSPHRGARPARKSSGEEDQAASTGRGSRHRAPAEKAKRPLPLLLGGAGVLVAALAIWFFGLRGAGEAPVTSAAEPLTTIDLGQLADQQPLEGTTEEDWAALNELVKRYCTPPFGSASVQCGDRLMIQGKRAVPAILNGFKGLDLATAEGTDIGWKIQTLLLQGLCGDTNFGWRRETRPADVHFNQQVIQRWFEAWEAAGTDDEAWAEIARLKAVPPGLAKASKDGESSQD